MEYRIEKDTMGEIKVPANKYWGAQTQRSLENFKIGEEKMPIEIIRAFGILKEAAAIANHKFNKLDSERLDIISSVCDEISKGQLDQHFPLSVWQTGSGTQSNMNVNEVIAHRGNELVGKMLLHPNDHVNMSQSSNDTFPTAMHIAAVLSVTNNLVPAINGLISTFNKLEEKYTKTIKSGRTHLQDATPISFSQEISGWRKMLEKSKSMIEMSMVELCELALGATAVGTGLNAPQGFDKACAHTISTITGLGFKTAENKFHALTSMDGLVFTHGAMKALAADLMKIANDVRWLASGPRCGIGEITIPENEPGSSIMPGKVNPTQCEALTMVCVQVMANDNAISISASQGNFQLNVYLPIIIYNFLQSARLLSDSIHSFNINCACAIKANEEKMAYNLHNSLMLVTALNPYIGYEKSALVAKTAFNDNISLREAVLKLGLMEAWKFDQVFKPEEMI